MIMLDNDNFEKEVLNAEGYVLVDFWGESCEPCKALMPHVEELSEKYEGKIKFCKLNTSNARRLAIKQKVLGLPTIAFYKDGAKVESLTAGKATATNIEDSIKKFI